MGHGQEVNTHPQWLGFPLSEQDSPGLFTHRPQTPQRSFQEAAAGTHATPAPNRAHSGSQGETRRLSLHRPQRGFVLPAKLPPKEQPEKVDARLMACVRFLRRRGPAGLRSSSVHLQNRQDPLQSLLYYGTIGLPVNG